jgi:hypothetical protein
MKYLLYGMVIMMFIAGVNSCKKSADITGKPAGASITGKWNYTAYYFSIGGPGSWQPVSGTNQWIELKENGSFSSNFAPFNYVVSYQLTDSIHIQFNKALGQDALLYRYALDTVKHELLLSDAINICTEGCAQKFAR